MRNEQISDIFNEMADVMEILGEDRFRINTYRKVARTIHDCGQDVAVLAAEDKLQALAGVGKSSAQKINEFVNIGSIAAHRELLQRIPPGLLELLKIPGFGPKGTAAVWKKLKVKNLSDLQRAIDEHKLETLVGFGEKKAAAIARGIAFIESARGRILLHHAQALAETILETLRSKSPKVPMEIAGSLRRNCETIGDIDILAQADSGEKIIQQFKTLPGVQQVISAGRTKVSVLFGDPEICPEVVQTDLRVVPAESMGAALQYFTGSKAHNVRLREAAIKQKLKLNEYGLFKDNLSIAGKTETDIYKALGLNYIAPELREDRGEIEAARQGQLPQLLDIADLRGDLHTHSPASDGRSTPEAMVEAAKQRGYRYLAVTDHSQSSVIANGLDVKRLLKHVEQVRKLNESLKNFSLLAGTEVDILADGSLDYPDEVLAELDFVIASVHSGMKGDKQKNTARLLKAMDTPYVNCIGHPTGRMIGVREPMDLDMETILQHAAKTHTAMEVSASPLRLDLKDVHCRMAVEAGVKLIINTDAHDTQGLYKMRFGVATARRGWVTPEQVLNCRSVKSLLKWIRQKRP